MTFAMILTVVSVLLLLSRFIPMCKQWWASLPKTVAVLLPPAVLLALPLVDVFQGAKTLSDIVWCLVFAAVMLVVGLAVPTAK